MPNTQTKNLKSWTIDWCGVHGRAAEFTAVFPNEHTVCWSGLMSGATKCELETVTVTRKEA